jgi:signal transduction histidine kinase
MLNRKIEPGLLLTFRYFTGIALVYFAVLVAFAIIQTRQFFSYSQIQLYINLLFNLVLFGYLSWKWLQRRLGGWYLPVALLAATFVPVFSHLLYLAEPQSRGLSLIIERSWLLFPILIVPLVLIAWQYSFRIVLIFTVFTAAMELSVLLPVVGRVDFETLPILGLPVVRAFAFGTVGHIVVRLIETQRAQRKALIQANIKLSQHALMQEQLATSRERNRLARELHDTLAHTLSGQAVNLEAIKLMLPQEQTEVKEMLNQALVSIRSGLAETRRALKDLRPQPVEDLGLVNAMRNLALDAASRAAFELNMEIASDLPPLSREIEQSTYRIVQEALENIVRHADAQEVLLTMDYSSHQLSLIIRDDGRGINLKDHLSVDSLGIRGMQERAAMVGGNLEVNSQMGRGTTIHFSVGVPDDQSTHM